MAVKNTAEIAFETLIRNLHEHSAIKQVTTISCKSPTPLLRRPWEVGCSIYIPKDMLMEIQINPFKVSRFIPVVVRFPDGMLLGDRLPISYLFAQGTDTDGKFHYADGSVSEKLRAYPTIAEALPTLWEKTIWINEVYEFEVLRNDELHKKRIYRFDFR